VANASGCAATLGYGPQAVGDFESLGRAGRRAVHLHLPTVTGDLLEQAVCMCLRRTP